MWRKFLGRLALVLVAGACWLPAAQAANSGSEDQVGRMTYDENPTTSDTAPQVPALQYLVAGLSAALVLVVVCAPSRKQYAKDEED